jgi:hypothetical protein
MPEPLPLKLPAVFIPTHVLHAAHLAERGAGWALEGQNGTEEQSGRHTNPSPLGYGLGRQFRREGRLMVMDY